MVGDIKGYCILKSDADLTKCMHSGSNDPFNNRSDEEIQKELKEIWISRRLRCLEINEDTESFLLISSDGVKIGMVDKKDVGYYFHCEEQNGIILPPNLDFMDQMVYAARAMNRKGGYNNIVKHLVIAASLHRGEFCDSILWAKQ